MKIRSLFTNDKLNKKSEWIIDFYSQWMEWIKYKEYSWCEFNFITFYVEWDKMFGKSFEVVFAFLGFNLRIRRHDLTSEKSKQLKNTIDRIKSGEEKLYKFEDIIKDNETVDGESTR
jgi:hypothetical protein